MARAGWQSHVLVGVPGGESEDLTNLPNPVLTWMVGGLWFKCWCCVTDDDVSLMDFVKNYGRFLGVTWNGRNCHALFRCPV